MKIKVPTYTLGYGLTDHELVFANLMLFFANDASGAFKGYRYYMRSDDIKHILGITYLQDKRNEMSAKALSNLAPEFDSIKRVFRLGAINFSQWFVQFPDNIPAEYISRNGRLMHTDIELKDLEAIKLYFYLAGRLSGTESIISESIKILDEKEATARVSSVMHPFFKEHTLI